MERFDYQHFDGVTIEPGGPGVRLDYSEPDQGATRLMIQYRIPCSGLPAEITGYAHDASLRERPISFADIPLRVLDDARNWIGEQLSKSKSKSGNMQILRNVLATLNKETAQPASGPYFKRPNTTF